MSKKKDTKFVPSCSPLNIGLPGIVGESSVYDHYYSKSNIRGYADKLRKNLTKAEKTMYAILVNLNGGALKGRFKMQHPISGKWIVDIFFPENRLAIEIDGSIHNTEEQKLLDKLKEEDCERFDITLIRITNQEVFGNRDQLIQKLRLGWKKALERENKTIGKPVS